MSRVVMLRQGSAEGGDARFDAARLLDLSPTALSYWDRDLQCLSANPAFRDWFGVDPEIVVGCNLEDVLKVLCLEIHVECVEAALQGERRSIVHAFHEGPAKRDGLVQYVPDMFGHLVRGLLLQVSPIPSRPRLARFRR